MSSETLFFFTIEFQLACQDSTFHQKVNTKIKGVLTGYTVAMVTCNVSKNDLTCSPLIGHLFDIIIVASTENEY